MVQQIDLKKAWEGLNYDVKRKLDSENHNHLVVIQWAKDVITKMEKDYKRIEFYNRPKNKPKKKVIKK